MMCINIVLVFCTLYYLFAMVKCPKMVNSYIKLPFAGGKRGGNCIPVIYLWINISYHTDTYSKNDMGEI